MGNKYSDAIGSSEIIVSVREVLDEQAANAVDSKIRSQKADIEKPVKISVDTKDAKNELKVLEKQLKSFTGKINRNLSSLSVPDMKEVLGIVGKLKDAEGYADKIQDTFGNIAASFSGVGLISGLDDVLEKFQESADTLRDVDWGFGKLYERKQLIEDQKEIIGQLKQIGRLRRMESRGRSGIDIFAEGFDEEDYASRFEPEELQKRLDLLQELRENVQDYVQLTKAKKVELFDDEIYQPNNFTYAIGSAIKEAQKQLEAFDDYDIPSPEEILQKFYDHVDGAVDRRNVSRQLQSDIEYYAEAILNSRYTLENAINDFNKDIEIDKLNIAWEEMIWDVDIPSRLLSMPEEYAMRIRNGSIELHDAISYMQEAINEAKEMSLQYGDDYLDDIGDLFDGTGVRDYSTLIEECTQLTGELSDATEKYTKIHREMMSVLDSGNNIPDELYEARSKIEKVISGYFKKDFFEPTLGTDGILMWLQSSEAAAKSIDDLVEDIENKYQRMLEAQVAHDSIAAATEREREATVEILGIRKEIQRIESNASKYQSKDNYIKTELKYYSSALKSLNKQKDKLVDFKMSYGDIDFSSIINEVHSEYKKAAKMLVANISQRFSTYVGKDEFKNLLSDVKDFNTLPKEQLDLITKRAQAISEFEKQLANELTKLDVKNPRQQIPDFESYYDSVIDGLSSGAIEVKAAIEQSRAELEKIVPRPTESADETFVPQQLSFDLNKIEEQVEDTVQQEQVLLESTQSVVQEIVGQADAAKKATGAIEGQVKATKKLQKEQSKVKAKEKQKSTKKEQEKLKKEETKQAVDFIQKSVDDALKQLRDASNNKTALVDLTEVTSVGELENRVKTMAQNIAGAYLKVDSVIVQDNIARITLYNDQLGITASQMWKLQKATEDAGEAQLELMSTLQKHSPRAAEKYSDTQQKKIDDANRWLISQMGVLDKQEISYKHSAKKVRGDTEILNLDEQYFGKTLDELANEIREKITGAMDGALTQSVRNEITDALRVLRMEIQVAQAEQYVKGRLSAQKVESAKETSEYRLAAFEEKAIKNNVFTQLENDIKSMRKELDSVTDQNSGGLQRFVDMMRAAEAHYSAEVGLLGLDKKEQSDYDRAATIQEKLYDLRKKLAKLESEGKTDEKLSRQIREQEQKYKLALDVLDTEKQIADILERETNLETELKNVRKEAEKVQAEKKKAAEEKQFANRLKSHYTEWVKNLKEINKLETQINNLRLQDKGTGLYAGRIQDTQDLKSSRIAELRILRDEINQTLSADGIQHDGGFVEFLDYCRERAILTADEIQNVNQLLVQTDYIEQDFNIKSKTQQLKDQKQAYDELISLQKKYNEADYKWHKAEIADEDKGIYNEQMESYLRRMQAIESKITLTQDQEIERNKINNEHLQRKNKLLEDAAKKEQERFEAEQKYTQQVEAINSKVESQIDAWYKDNSFTSIFPDELNQEINAFLGKLESIDQDTNFGQLNKEWDKIILKTKQAKKAHEEYITSAWKDRFQNEYKYHSMPSSYDDGEYYVYDSGKTKQDQGILDHMADYYRQEAEKAEQDAKAFNDNVTSIYDRLMKATKELNSVDDRINKLTLKDGGTGLYAGSIQSLQDQKSYLVSDLRSINDEIKSALSFDDSVSNPIRSFFEDTRVQAILTTEEIEKFQNAMQEMSDKGFGFKETVAAQIQPFVEKLQSLKQMIAGGLIDKNTQSALNVLQADSVLSKKWGDFSQNPDAFSASDILKFVKANNEYIDSLEKAASKEAEYFAAKKQYANIASMQDFSEMAAGMDKASDSTGKARENLEKFVNGFADGHAIITGFTTSADGISKINFSVLEEGTGHLRSFSAEMGRFTDNIYTVETSMNNMTSGASAAQKTLASMSQVMSRLNSYGMTSDNNNYVDDLYNKMQALGSAFKELGTSKDVGDQNTLLNMAADADRLIKKILALEKAYLSMNDAVADGNAQKVGNIASGEDPYEKMVQIAKEVSATMPGCTLEVGKFNEKTKQLPYIIETADGEVQTFIMTMEKFGGVVVSEVKTVDKAKTAWQEFGSSFGGLGKDILKYGANLIQVYDIIRYLRQGFNEVLEIDTAMTELKKVTDETSVAYKNFLDSAYTSAKKLGSTMKEFTEATADFARLGYSIEDASMLAEAANVYMNVGDGIEDVGTASESIISTMKAFNIEAEGSMGIVDRFNEVGNNFAIDSVGIGDALQRSASALAEAGNTIDESIALVTGANTVVQNPEQVGTALKTLALRLRGAKVELEEAGLETDNMAESTATLQSKLKALTHGKVDIMLDPDTFKSTTQILREMADAWEHMTDIERAAALELMGGKRQANILSSLISNYDIVENVIQTSANSANSAIEENAKYLDSMQGRIDQLTNSIQSMWVNAMDSEFLKFIISVADGFVQATDKVGLFNVALAAIMAKTAFSGKKFGIANLFTSVIEGANGATKGITLLGKALPVASTGFKIFNAAATMGISLLAGLAIKGLVKLADEIIVTKEEIVEAAREAEDAIQSLNEEFKSDAKTVSDYAERFAELAQGVDMLTGKNLSLSTDDYAEFLDISNQLADIFPTLTRNYDENGNAIVQLSGDTDTIVGSLYDLLDVQRQIANQQIAEELPTLYTGVKVKSDEYAQELDALESRRDAFINQLNKISSKDFVKDISDGLESGILSVYDESADTETMLDMRNTYTALLNELGLAFQELTPSYKVNKDTGIQEVVGFTLQVDYTGMSEEEIEKAKSNITAGISELAGTYSTEIGTLNNKIQTSINENKANWGSLSSAIASWLSTDSSYQVLSDDMQSMVQTVINNLDYTSLDFKSWEKAQKWIQDNILSIFTDPEIRNDVNKELVEMFNFQSLFKNSSIGLGTYQDELIAFVDFIKSLGLKEDVQEQILQMFDIKIEEDKISLPIDEMVKHVQEITNHAFDNQILTLNYSELQIINSDKFNVDGSTIATWDQLQAEIQEARVLMTQDFTADNFADYAESISTISSNISTYQEALESLESGSFTLSDFMSLIEQFPELADGVDASSKSFNGLSTNLRKAIRNSPDELVDELKDLRKQLVLAGKSTDSIDQLIDSIKNMPTDAVKNLSEEFITLSDKINEAKAAHEGLQEAMSENPNEGYETRGEAMEQMKTLMGEGKIGSESELWSIAEAYGFTYDSAKSINDNADALANFIAVRQDWYKTDDDGNYTFEGTERFLNDVEKVVNSDSILGEKLRDLDVRWNYDDKNGKLDFDFNNENWDQIIKLLSSSKELAGLTSEEFYDLLMQVGQFFDINWQDANDLIWYLDQINSGTESASENFESTKNAVLSFLESSGYSTDLLEIGVDDDEFKALPSEVQDVLSKYYELKTEFEEDPLGIKFRIDKNSGEEIAKETIESLSQLTTILQDNKTGTVFIDYSSLEEAAKNAGYADEAIEEMIASIQEYNNVCGITTSESDLIGLVSLKDDAINAERYLEALGIQFEAIKNADNTIYYSIDAASLIDTLTAQGWTASSIMSYFSTLQQSGAFSFTLDGADIKLSDTEAREKLNNLLAEKESLSEPETTEYIVTGTGEASVDRIKSMWAGIPRSKKTNYSIYETTYEQRKKYNPETHRWDVVAVNGTAHARGTAFATGSWGAPKTETALVGELGPELLVRNGRWTTIGDNGAEFTQIKKGDIIFNHKQTEDLLSKGYVTGRGKAFASGTAYSSANSEFAKYSFDGNNGYTKYDVNSVVGSLSDAASDAADEFREVFDWIEVRLEEITKNIDYRSAQLENQTGYTNQNKVVDDMIDLNQKLYDNLIAGANKYYEYSESLLAKIPAEYREAAKNGTIAIETFAGEVGEETLGAIQEYRDWVQKGDDAARRAEETFTEISNLAKQAIDNIANQFENEASLRDSKTDQLDAYNALLETTYGAESEAIYKALIQVNKDNIAELEKQRDAMQQELNEQVEAGNIEKYSQNWYDAVNDIAALDTSIIELKTDLNDLQDSINELHWQHFDLLMSKMDAVSEEAENLIDILQTKDVVDEVGNWTDEGITALGLYAQQMEVAEVKAAKYAEEIAYLNENWQKLGYTEEEYIEKLDELKSGQYDSIQAYNDAKDAIVDLNKERVDAIKDGIEKEIDAYEELIKKKKEELDAEKDLYDFQKSITKQEKDLAQLRRELAALSADNSASARAKKAQLEAEIAEAEAELQESYYERSVANRQDALDKELENFQDEKDAELEGWDEYLENTNKVVSDSLATVQANTDAVYQTLLELGEEYSLSITDSLISPWEEGSTAIQNYSEQFKLSMSATVEELEKLSTQYEELMQKIESAGTEYTQDVDDNFTGYQEASEKEKEKPAPSTPTDNGSDNKPSTAGLVSSLSGNIQYGDQGEKVKKLQRALNELGYGNSGTQSLDGIFGSGTQSAVKAFQSAMGIAVDGIVGPDTKSKFKTKGYAKGSTGVDFDQLAQIDELGEELLVRVQNGRLTYLEKGTGVVPADLTENLMGWGRLDPSIMLDQNRPAVGVHPEIHNTQIQIDNSVAELIHIDHCDQNTLPDVKKIVDEALEKHTQKLNNSLRKYTR